MEKKKNLINLIFSPKLLIIEWSIIIVFCIFIGFSIRGKCATVANGSLPYNVPQYREANSFIPDEVIEIALTRAESDARNFLGYQGELSYLIFSIDGIVNDRYYDIYFLPNPTITDNVLSDYNFLDGTIRVWANDIQIQRVIVDKNNGSVGGGFINLGRYADLLGDATTSSLNGGNFTPRYPFKMIGISEIKSANDVVVFTNTVAPVTPNGHATPPDLTGDNIGNDKPDIDDYLPNIPTMPSLDNSSLEKIAESIYNILQWGFNAIKGTLNGLFKYLGDTITYSIQKVIDNIKNAIQNFYNNMVSLFEPLLNGLAEIAQGIKQTIENIGLLLEAFFAPFDEEQFKEAYQNCEFINAVDGVNDSIEEFEHAFTYAEERDYYTLYLGFIMDGYTVNYDLDFTWLYPLRQYYRPIIWAVVIYEFFVYLCSQLSDYLQGRSGK